MTKLSRTTVVAASTLLYKPPLRPRTDHLPVLRLDDMPSTTLMRTLSWALSLKRPYGSIAEARFVAWLANRLPVSLIDGAGNLHVDLRTDLTHRSMFTSHTDTVHNNGGSNVVRVDGDFWRADEHAALGADDGAGIALMCHMIEAGVPGYYLFCRGEESGGIGSSWLADSMPSIFTNIDRAVAFDRAGYSDVITHQSGGRCCSDIFADALATALTTEEDWYLPCSTGVYTDTAEFTKLVPECTNLSVGYAHQHGDEEKLNVKFLVNMAKQLVQIDWDALPVKRDHTKREPSHRHSYASVGEINLKSFGDIDWADKDDEDEDDINPAELELMVAIEEAMDGSFVTLLDLIANYADPENPAHVVRMLSAKPLTDAVLEEYVDLLGNGLTADEALEELLLVTQRI